MKKDKMVWHGSAAGPLVSVVITTYNGTPYLEETLKSVRAQTYRNIEVIVVDDGSIDPSATQRLVRAYFPRASVIKQRNCGVAHARNRGFRLAQGKYIAFLDHDDIWLQDKIRKEVAALEANPHWGFVFSGAYLIDEQGIVFGERRLRADEETIFAEFYKKCLVWSPSLTLVRRTCIDAVEGFDEQIIISADYDLWLRMAKRYAFGYVDEILCQYRMHQEGMSNDWEGRLNDHLRIFSKPEITAGKSWWQRKRRLAQVYYDWAVRFYAAEKYGRAGQNFLAALSIFPLIGLYHWPLECKKWRFTFIYRILKVYAYLIDCWWKVRCKRNWNLQNRGLAG